jgi:iron(III) transport system permease protein
VGSRLQRPLILALMAALLGVAIVPPIVEVGRELFGSFAASTLLLEPRLWWLLWRSLALSGAATALSLMVGVPLGVLFEAAQFPGRRLLLAGHAGIVFVPPFLPTLGWFHIFGQQGLLGSPRSASLLFSEVGLVLTLSACFAPIVTLLTVLGVAGVKGSLVDAARLVSGPFRTAVRVLVPCAAPTIALSAVIVFALSFSELGAPMFLRVDVYPAVVFSRLGGMDFSPGEAALFVLPLLLVAAGLLFLERRFAGARAVAALGSDPGSRQPLFAFRARALVIALVAAGLSFAPLLALGWRASVHGGFSEMHRWLGASIGNGLGASTSAALLTIPIALVLGVELARGTRFGSWLDGAAMLAFILPSSVLGVGMMLAWNQRATQWFYQSPGILVIGFVARYAAIAIRTFAAAVTQIPPSLDGAAQTVGAGYLRRLTLTARIAPRGLLGAFLLSLIFALRDLETAVIYYPPGGETLTVRIFTLEANGPPGVISALALVHIAITFVVVGVAVVPFRAAVTT